MLGDRGLAGGGGEGVEFYFFFSSLFFSSIINSWDAANPSAAPLTIDTTVPPRGQAAIVLSTRERPGRNPRSQATSTAELKLLRHHTTRPDGCFPSNPHPTLGGTACKAKHTRAVFADIRQVKATSLACSSKT